jgi:large subunit ribosomal protein L33
MPQPVRVALVCSQCGARNYHKKRAPQGGQRLELKKFCPGCNKHTIHRESK